METEAPDYFWKYINQVVGNDPVAALVAQLDEISNLAAEFTEERSLYRYAEGKWSVREALSHVTDTERVFGFRALWFGRGFTEPLLSFDQDIAVAGAQADRLAWAKHVEEFRQVREAAISLFRNMPEEGWSRSGIASGKPVSVRALAFISAGHAAHHFKIVRERYLG
jgi:DinB superfamily